VPVVGAISVPSVRTILPAPFVPKNERLAAADLEANIVVGHASTEPLGPMLQAEERHHYVRGWLSG
jgi:hypothetical protein